VLDFLLGAILAALAVRGWLRGFLREALGLATLVLGVVVAFRLSTPVGGVVEGMAGLSPDVSRLVAGILIFVGISTASAVISHLLHRGMRIVPGLPTLNRLGGSAFALAAGVFVAILLVSVLRVITVPDAVESALDESAIARGLVDPTGPPQKTLGVLSGDRVIEQILSLQDVTGERRIVAAAAPVMVAPAERDDLEASAGLASRVVDLLNRERVAADAAPLARSEALDQIARTHARRAYLAGAIGEGGGDGVTVPDRLRDAGLPVVASDQVMVLAVSPKSAHEALVQDSDSRATMVSHSFKRAGVGVIKGPYGLLIVQIFTG
jgi:membrane protein required for colicin V production